MQAIPLQPVPSQTVNVLLGGQSTQITITQLSTGLYCELSVNNALIIGGVICQNLNRIVRNAYLGFVGDLMFADNEGTTDPDYTGLGDRFTFLYLEEGETAD